MKQEPAHDHEHWQSMTLLGCSVKHKPLPASYTEAIVSSLHLYGRFVYRDIVFCSCTAGTCNAGPPLRSFAVCAVSTSRLMLHRINGRDCAPTEPCKQMRLQVPQHLTSIAPGAYFIMRRATERKHVWSPLASSVHVPAANAGERAHSNVTVTRRWRQHLTLSRPPLACCH